MGGHRGQVTAFCSKIIFFRNKTVEGSHRFYTTATATYFSLILPPMNILGLLGLLFETLE